MRSSSVAQMHPPRADDIAPLPVFSRQKTFRLRGPRPRMSWLQMETPAKEEAEGGWPWTCRQADLSRTSTIYSCTSSESSISNQSSVTSESESTSSPCINHTPNSPFDHESSSRRHKPRPQRRKPSGPRPPSGPHSPNSPVRPTLSINTSLLPAIPPEQPVLPLPMKEFPQIAPTEPTTPAPQLPPAIPFPPSDLLDWDTIFELLGVEK